MKRPALDKAFTKIVSSDTTRYNLCHPFAYKGMVCATNGHVMVLTGFTDAADATYLPLPLMKPVDVDGTPPDPEFLFKLDPKVEVSTVVLPDIESIAELGKFPVNSKWRFVVNKGIVAASNFVEGDVIINPRYLADVALCLFAGTGTEDFEASFTDPLSPVFIRPKSTMKIAVNASAPSILAGEAGHKPGDVGIIMPMRA